MPTQPFASGGGSTIAQPVGPQTKATSSQRALASVRRMFFTEDDVKDPKRLYQVLYQITQGLTDALRQVAENPVGGGNLLTGVVFTTNQTLYLSHGLGRPYRGWWPARAQGLAASMVEAALPTGVTSSQVLPITSANAGVYAIYVF
jgi:hypothetical protein